MTVEGKIRTCEALPQVALEFMNTVHCDELELTLGLLSALQENESVEKIDVLLDQWVEHTVAHFAREERLMEEYRFPPYTIHQSEHRHALQVLRDEQAKWGSVRDISALKSYIERDWWAWLCNHIATMDTVTANFLSQFDIKVDLDLD